MTSETVIRPISVDPTPVKRLTLYLNNPFLFTIELFSISGRFKATFFFVKYFLSPPLKGFEIIVTTCDSDFKGSQWGSGFYG